MRALILARRAHEEIVRDCLAHARAETGGVLVGRSVGDDLVVPFVVGAGPRSIRTYAGFAPDPAYQQQHVDYLFHRFGVNYVGDWHRHPGRFDTPSDHDCATAARITTDPAWNTPLAAFPIAVIDRGHVRVRAFLMARGAHDFRELPLQITEDSDPLMQAALLALQPSRKETSPYVAIQSSHRPAPRAARRALRHWIARYLRSSPRD